jgi:hypothetical protein
VDPPAGRDGPAAPIVRAAAGDPGAADLTRTRLQLVHDRTREWQRLELLEGALVKLSSVLSSLARTKTARAVLEAIADDERDPRTLAGLASAQVKADCNEVCPDSGSA